MRTLNRICLKNFEIEDEEGTKFTLKRGQEYLTSEANIFGKVTVFSTYWVPDVPVNIFGGEKVFTK